MVVWLNPVKTAPGVKLWMMKPKNGFPTMLTVTVAPGLPAPITYTWGNKVLSGRQPSRSDVLRKENPVFSKGPEGSSPLSLSDFEELQAAARAAGEYGAVVWTDAILSQTTTEATARAPPEGKTPIHGWAHTSSL